MKELIRLEHVFKSYSDNMALENINLSIKEGSFTALIGNNGAGKSTLLRIIAGLEERVGKVTYRGIDPFAYDSSLSSQIFHVHENIPLNTPITLQKFIGAYAEVFVKWDGDVFRNIMSDRKLDLGKYFHDLSRGQKVQFLLALALSSGAETILCDEVTSMLDFDAQFYFLNALRKFVNRGGTVIMATNILSELDEYADHVILLKDTKIFIDAAIEDLRRDYVLAQTELSHLKIHATSVRSRDGFRDIFLVKRGDSEGWEIISSLPRIEDFLLLSFQKARYENLVA